MEILLIFLIVLLSGAICALAGFWFYRAAQERKQRVRPPQIARRAVRDDPWERAVRASRDKA
jgi:hypothetical protein